MKTGFTKAASRTLVTAATRNGRTMIAVVMGTWDDTGWAGYLLDQGFASAAGAPCAGAKLPAVRAVTADQRRQVFEGLPPALGTPSLDGGAAATVAGATTVGSTDTTRPKASAGETKHPTTTTSKVKAEVEALNNAQTASATTESSGGSGVLGSIFNLKVFVIFVVLVLFALFLLRRRAVRRQRARRIARQKQMAEIRRRHMIDVVDPATVEADEVSHVKVVPTRR